METEYVLVPRELIDAITDIAEKWGSGDTDALTDDLQLAVYNLLESWQRAT